MYLIFIPSLHHFFLRHYLPLGKTAIRDDYRPFQGKIFIKLNRTSLVLFIFIHYGLNRSNIWNVFSDSGLCLAFSVFNILNDVSFRYLLFKLYVPQHEWRCSFIPLMPKWREPITLEDYTHLFSFVVFHRLRYSLTSFCFAWVQ